MRMTFNAENIDRVSVIVYWFQSISTKHTVNDFEFLPAGISSNSIAQQLMPFSFQRGPSKSLNLHLLEILTPCMTLCSQLLSKI